MSVSVKRMVRFLAIGVAIAICSLVINSYFGTADDACADHGCSGTCPHEVCFSDCWADGTYTDANSCTKVKHTPFAPIGCEPGGGCITQSCN